MQLPENVVQQISDTDEYLTVLAELAYGTGLENEQTAATEVRFAGTGSREQVENAVFRPDQGRIYAKFDTVGVASDHVVVQWRKRDSGEIVALRSYPIDASKNRNYVWIEKLAWEPGVYSVKIMRPRDLSVISGGTFDVW